MEKKKRTVGSEDKKMLAPAKSKSAKKCRNLRIWFCPPGALPVARFVLARANMHNARPKICLTLPGGCAKILPYVEVCSVAGHMAIAFVHFCGARFSAFYL